MPDNAVPVPNPDYVIDGSKLKASLITLASLVGFGIFLFGAIVRNISAHNFVGLWVLLQRDDTLAFITTITPPALLCWRMVVAWLRKKREVDVAEKADDSVVMTKEAYAAALAAASGNSSPTRAPEATTAEVDSDPFVMPPASTRGDVL